MQLLCNYAIMQLLCNYAIIQLRNYAIIMQLCNYAIIMQLLIMHAIMCHVIDLQLTMLSCSIVANFYWPGFAIIYQTPISISYWNIH